MISCAFRTALIFVGESWEVKLEDVWVGIGYGWLLNDGFRYRN